MSDNQQPTGERQLALQRIYLKDASFESPNTPDAFRQQGEPQHELNLNTKINRLGDDAYEVVLAVTVTTKLGDQTAFIVEVQQAGIFGIRGFRCRSARRPKEGLPPIEDGIRHTDCRPGRRILGHRARGSPVPQRKRGATVGAPSGAHGGAAT
ncbi:MAG: protein-export chaperone SecB [Chromatiaceae bacterium]